MGNAYCRSESPYRIASCFHKLTELIGICHFYHLFSCLLSVNTYIIALCLLGVNILLQKSLHKIMHQFLLKMYSQFMLTNSKHGDIIVCVRR
nr:MAG TPA: hypothetical protein [Caudoviricetes sp.]